MPGTGIIQPHVTGFPGVTGDRPTTGPVAPTSSGRIITPPTAPAGGGGGSDVARQFTASGSNKVTFSAGAFASNTFDYGTVAAVVSHTDNGAWQDVVNLRQAGGTGEVCVLEISDFDQWWFSIANINGVNGPVVGTGSYCVVVTKGNGSVVPRFHVYNYGTSTWQHSNANAALANGSATVTSIVVGEYPGGFDYQNSKISAVGVYRHWVPDDAAVEAAGFHTDLDNFVAAGTNSDIEWVVSFNQTSTATAVTDLTGGGGDQTAIVGTSVTTGPAAFDNSIGGAGTTHDLDGTVASTSDISGSLSVARALDGTVAGVSTATADLGVVRNMDGSLAGTSGASGSLGVIRPMSGTVAAASSLSGDVVRVLPLSGTVGGVSSLSGSMVQTLGLTGTLDALSSLSGSPVVALVLSGTVASTSDLAGGLGVTRSLQGAILGQPSLDGSLAVVRGLDGTIAATSSIAGDLVRTLGLSGTVTSVSVIDGDLLVGGDNDLSGIIGVTSTISGELSVIRGLSGSIDATSSLQGDLVRIMNIDGQLVAVSTLSGEMGRVLGIDGQLVAVSALNGDLEVRGPVVILGGVFSGSRARAVPVEGSRPGATVAESGSYVGPVEGG